MVLKRKKFHNGKRAIKYIACAVGVFIALLLIIILLRYLDSKDTYVDQEGDEQYKEYAYTDGDAQTFYKGNWYRLRKHLDTILLFGVDKFESSQLSSDSYMQADFISLLVLDNANKTAFTIHINRDTMAEFPSLDIMGKKIGTVREQITLSHTYGTGGKDSCANTVRAVSDLLYGIEIDHYIRTTMDSVSVLNDMVGGVEVTLEDDFTFIDDSFVAGATVTLVGDEALRYVRARGEMEDSTNLARMVRQRQYLTALYEKTKRSVNNNESFSLNALLEISSYITSDCSTDVISRYINKAMEYEMLGIYSLEGETDVVDDHVQFECDQKYLQELIIDLFYEQVSE